MAEDRAATCRRNSWLAAALCGALVAAMLIFLAQSTLLKAVLIGLLVFGLLGLFLGWAFCSGAGSAEAAGSVPQAAPPAKSAAAKSAAAIPEAAKPEAEPVFKSRPFAGSAGDTEVPASPRAAAASQPAPVADSQPAPSAAPDPAPVEATPGKRRKPAAKAGSDAAFGLDAALAKSKDDPGIDAPEMLGAPRNGTPDDLKQIRGIGPKLEKLLNEVGVWHFDQIATWKAKDIAFVDEKMVGFRGRITRDEWVKQAKLLAKGGETAFSAKVKKGGVY